MNNFSPRFIISDHIRAIVFIVAEGVLPAGKGRGYVLRRLMRRLISSSLKLGIDINDIQYFTELINSIVNQYSEIFPQLISHSETVTQLMMAESQKYQKAINVGVKEWSKYLQSTITIV